MLGDRHYMRSRTGTPRWPVSIVLMIAITAAFGLQQINEVYFHSNIYPYLVLSPVGLSHGYIWQLVTFQFLHGGLWHLLCNLVGIWFFGRFVEERLGPGNFLKLYFASGVFGGLLQSLLGWVLPSYFGGGVVGASAGVFGLLAAFAVLEPESEIYLFCVFPVKSKYLLIAVTGIAIFFTIVPSDGGVAHAAHLGGIMAGVAYIRWGLYSRSWSLNWLRFRNLDWRPFKERHRKRELVKVASIKPVPWPQRKEPVMDEETTEDFISHEVDPILDKISAHGIQSLTPRERKILEAARARMEKQ
jgi:rhomboid family protein